MLEILLAAAKEVIQIEQRAEEDSNLLDYKT